MAAVIGEEEPVLLPPIYGAPHAEVVHGGCARWKELDHGTEMAWQGSG